MKIHGDLNSGNCLKVKWVSDHLSFPIHGSMSTPARAKAGRLPLAAPVAAIVLGSDVPPRRRASASMVARQARPASSMRRWRRSHLPAVVESRRRRAQRLSHRESARAVWVVDAVSRARRTLRYRVPSGPARRQAGCLGIIRARQAFRARSANNAGVRLVVNAKAKRKSSNAIAALFVSADAKRRLRMTVGIMRRRGSAIRLRLHKPVQSRRRLFRNGRHLLTYLSTSGTLE